MANFMQVEVVSRVSIATRDVQAFTVRDTFTVPAGSDLEQVKEFYRLNSAHSHEGQHLEIVEVAEIGRTGREIDAQHLYIPKEIPGVQSHAREFASWKMAQLRSNAPRMSGEEIKKAKPRLQKDRYNTMRRWMRAHDGVVKLTKEISILRRRIASARREDTLKRLQEKMEKAQDRLEGYRERVQDAKNFLSSIDRTLKRLAARELGLERAQKQQMDQENVIPFRRPDDGSSGPKGPGGM